AASAAWPRDARATPAAPRTRRSVRARRARGAARSRRPPRWWRRRARGSLSGGERTIASALRTRSDGIATFGAAARRRTLTLTLSRKAGEGDRISERRRARRSRAASLRAALPATRAG